MATVPTVEAPLVAPEGLPSARQNIAVDPGAFGAIQGAQNEQLGGSILRAGDELSRINYYQQNLANRTRIDAAKAAAIGAQTDLAYGAQYDPAQPVGPSNDPNAPMGFRTRKGEAALGLMPDGSDMATYYTGAYQKKIDGIAAGLTPYQKEIFTAEMAPHVAQFRNAVVVHRVQEYQTSQVDAQASLLDNVNANAVVGYQSKDTIDSLADQAAGAATKLAQLGKGSATENVLKATSKIHLSAIEAALADNNTPQAQVLFEAYNHAAKGVLDTTGMRADDMLTAAKKLKAAGSGQQALTAVQETAAKYANVFVPGDLDRLKEIRTQLESGGRGDFETNGKPVTGAAGELYANQVKPETARAPGFGIRPVNETGTPKQVAAEYNRVGDQYLEAMVQRYGSDPSKAMAAYNAGPGAVDAAIAKAEGAAKAYDPKDSKAQPPGNWLSYLPEKTQNYATTGAAKFRAGQGSPLPPTKDAFVEEALSRLPPGASPQTQQLTQQHAEHKYGLLIDGRKQAVDKATTDVQQALFANGGDMTTVDPSLLTRLNTLNPSHQPATVEFANKVADPPKKTDNAQYNIAVANPESLTKMSDPQFNAWLVKNISPTQQKELTDMRAKTAKGVDALNDAAVNTSVHARLYDLGIDAKPKPDDKNGNAQVGAVQQYVRADLFAQQRALGRQLDEKEIEGRVNTLFSKSVDLPGIIYGTNNKPMLSMKVGDIPSAARDAIKAGYAANGIQNPTDAQMLNQYWKSKNAR